MKKIKNPLFYVVLIGGFSVLVYWLLRVGRTLEEGREVVQSSSLKGQWDSFIESVRHNLHHPLALLLAQIVTIVVVAKLFGWLCSKIGQPTVVGEMIAGIVLGPSLLGLYFPEISASLFPAASLGNLQFLSQIGLILFMFIVGMELDLKVLRNQTHEAVVISHASIVVPFAMGIGLAYFIYQDFAPDKVQFSSFGLFMGIAMSITAFPVLARIVQERGISKTRLGNIVITCAAADDITAWCILAAVIAIVKAGSFVSSIYTILMAIAYVVIMIKLVHPFLKRIGNIYSSKETLTKPIIAIFFLVLIFSAFATEVIGIHALFGAFMAGAIMPDNMKFRTLFVEKIEDVALVLLLPLFFVFTGLRTQIGLLNDANLWYLTGIIVLIAVAGKFLGSALAARFVGQNWKDSLSIGALMNTRGLMELVVLNIGFDLGVLSAEVFSMMVLMALITTFMTGPALDFINWIFKKKDEQSRIRIKEISKYRILLSFDKPEAGKGLLKLANSLTFKNNNNSTITALHLSPAEEYHYYGTEEFEKQSFKPVMEASADLNREIIPLFKSSTDPDSEIAQVANKGDYDLLLVNMRESIYEGSFLGRLLGYTTRIMNPEKILNTVTGKENIFEASPIDDHSRLIMAKTNIPVGIFVDKNLDKIERVIIPLFEAKDLFIIDYAQKLIHNIDAQVLIYDASDIIKNDTTIREKLQKIQQKVPQHLSIFSEKDMGPEILAAKDLVMISSEGWKRIIETKEEWFDEMPSTLIMSQKQADTIHNN